MPSPSGGGLGWGTTQSQYLGMQYNTSPPPNLLQRGGNTHFYKYFYGFLLFWGIFTAFSANAGTTKAPYNPWLADYTSTELKELLKNGYNRILIPTAGIEQNGQFASLNKHEKVLRFTMSKIAHTLQKTLVVPIVNYVPEGSIFPPSGHTAFTGTISIPESTFQSVLLNTVISLAQQGFKKFYFLGDSGGNQATQNKTAAFLQKQGYHAFAISEYYANDVQNDYLIQKYHFTLDQIGTHIGIRDTSELLYASPESVRTDKITNNQNSDFNQTGGNGNATLATPVIGKELLAIKINQAIKAIKLLEK